MQVDRGQKRAVSICLRSFSADPEALSQNFSNVNAYFIKIGDKRGHSNVAKNNYLALWMPINACEKWNGYIDELVTSIGGWEKLRQFIAEVQPKEASLRIDAPMLESPYVESNYLEPRIIKEMAATGLSLDMGIRNFDPDEPTHHPVDGPITDSD